MEQRLGYLLYFSLAGLQIPMKRFRELCRILGVNYKGGSSSLEEVRKQMKEARTSFLLQGIRYSLYVEEDREAGSWRLIEKASGPGCAPVCRSLAVIRYCRESDALETAVELDPLPPQAEAFLRRIERSFRTERKYAGTKTAEHIAVSYLDTLLASKVRIHGRVYFIPLPCAEGIRSFYRFMEQLNRYKVSRPFLECNSIPVPATPRQRRCVERAFAAEFLEQANECIYTVKSLLVSPDSGEKTKLRWAGRCAALLGKLSVYERLLDTDFAMQPELQALTSQLRSLTGRLTENEIPA